jgi:predicted nucleic acid-binding protein
LVRLIDASVVISIERKDLEPETVADVAADEVVVMASITVSELLVGVLRADNENRRARRHAFVEKIIESVMVVPFDVAVARVHARLAATLQAAGQSIGGNDLLVAATAVTYDCPVLTENLREFERIPGLTVYAPQW